MAEVFRQIDAGKLRKDTAVVLKESDKAGDETIPLNMLHAGVVLTVDDLLRFMIAYSDNTATNLLVGLVGTANVDALLDSYGLTKTRLYRPTFRDGHADVLPEEEKEFGLGSTTPREMRATLVELIAQGKVVIAQAGDDMIALLATQQDRAMIPRSLPFGSEEILVANKTGWDEEKNADAKGFKGDVRNDAAYVKTPEGALRHRDLRAPDPGQELRRGQRDAADRSRDLADRLRPLRRRSGAPTDYFFSTSAVQLRTRLQRRRARRDRAAALTRNRWPSPAASKGFPN